MTLAEVVVIIGRTGQAPPRISLWSDARRVINTTVSGGSAAIVSALFGAEQAAQVQYGFIHFGERQSFGLICALQLTSHCPKPSLCMAGSVNQIIRVLAAQGAQHRIDSLLALISDLWICLHFCGCSTNRFALLSRECNRRRSAPVNLCAIGASRGTRLLCLTCRFQLTRTTST